MEATHTPGPWAIAGHSATDGSISVGAGRCVVASVHNGVSFLDVVMGRSPEAQAANALLIAAAPDLLEALIGLDEAFCSVNEFSSREERHAARLALIAARSAITKATGAAA